LLEALRSRRLGRRLLLITVSVAGIGAALSQVDSASLLSAIRSVSVNSLVNVAAALAIGALLAGCRFKFIASDMGYRLSLRDAMVAMSIGQIAGTFFFQFFGQIAGRSAHLKSRGISMPANVMLSTYERVIAFGVSGILAIAGGWFLFGHVVLDLEGGGGKFLRIVAGGAVAVAAGAAFVWGRMAIDAMRPFTNGRMIIAIGRSIGVTLAVQLATTVAYVLAAKAIVPDARTLDVLSASVIVMFAASLPISFSGWGVRELSAVLALSVIGVSSGAALTISAMVGVLALAVVVVLAILALAVPSSGHVSRGNAQRNAKASIDIDAVVAWILPLAAGTMVFFQIHIPSGSGLLNVNVADPIAILGGCIFVYYFLGKSWPEWRLPGLNFFIVATSAVVILAFVHGYFSFGWSDWAFRNKLLGWFVLLGYGATGALLIRHAGRRGFETLLTTFAVVAAAIIAIELVFITATRMGLLSQQFSTLPMEGFSQNRNAFAFLQVLAFCALPIVPQRMRLWLLVLLFMGSWFTASRAAWGALAVIVPALYLSGHVALRQYLSAALLAVAGLSLIYYAPSVASSITSSDAGVYPFVMIGASPEVSIVDRWQSITRGFDLFLHHPIFGAGLGAFMEAQIKAGQPLVIHSTPVWLLAEMGIVGFAIFAVPVVRLFFAEARSYRENVSAFLLLIIVGFVMISSVHEILYQRAFWLLLGAAAAMRWRHEAAR
jgi:hypothetical protein